MLLEINQEHPQPRKIGSAIELFEAGEILVYPTDTGYGMGCDPFNRKAVERMFRLVNRPKNKPASLLCSDFKQIARYGYMSDVAFRIAKRVLPGPYTFIFKATKEIPRPLQGKRKEVGIRVPAHPIVQLLTETAGIPLLNFTVHDTHGEYIDDPHEIERMWGKQLGAVIDGDIIPEDPSTVVDFTGREPEILREGQGDLDAFME